MTASEILRKEMIQSASFSKNEFINTICERIKKSGEACFICDRHIEKTELAGCIGTIRMADEQAAIDFARSEGFCVSYKHNSYGVRYIFFTL